MMKTKYAALIFLFILNTSVHAQTKAENTWFARMFQVFVNSKEWNEQKSLTVFDELRERYNDQQSLLEMSWETRDSIWHHPVRGDNPYQILASRYRQAYLRSCRERGAEPIVYETKINDKASLNKLRDIYHKSRKAEYIVLTPKVGKEPRINGPSIYGVRPGNELIYRIPLTGEKPIKCEVTNLPDGCFFDEEHGVIRGSVAVIGEYIISVSAKNKYGEAEKEITLRVGDKIALTPPMGWNSWNAFGVDITAKDIEETADLLMSSGLADFGWTYVNIDDCWMLKPDRFYDDRISEVNKSAAFDFYKLDKKRKRHNENEVTGNPRDEQGNILPNKDFGDMKSLTDYLHKYGLKAGIYTSPGPYTCQIFEGSYGYEIQDAQRYAEWGFDFIKYDWCGYRAIVAKPNLEEAQHPYRLMGDALKNINRDIIYSLCQYGRHKVWEWGEDVGGHMWRTTGDIHDDWKRVVTIGFENQAGLETYAGPGRWNDPDMLVIGHVGWSKNLRPTYLSPNEQYAHVSLWSLLAAPLLIGCDLTQLDDFTYNLLSNAEVIAINQDVLGIQATKIIEDNRVEIWTKPLADGSIAVGIFNLGENPVDYTFSLSSLGLSGNYKVRDLWRQQDIGFLSSDMSVAVNRHGVELIRIKLIDE